MVARHKFNSRAVWKVLTQTARAMGHDFNYETTEDVFNDIAIKIPEFIGIVMKQLEIKVCLRASTKSDSLSITFPFSQE